jgi:MoaA/NifB/PqqE/SkfB family radical SAM enzyme
MKMRHLCTGEVSPGGLYKVDAAPQNVMFDVTWRCNHACTFCYNRLTSFVGRDPPPEVAHQVIDCLATWGVREVLYLGGEPTLHPEFFHLVEHGARLGLIQRVVTNGSRIDPQGAAILTRAGVETGVSLQGVSAAAHDQVTGVPGSHTTALEAVYTLLAAGADVFVQYSPTRVEDDGLAALAELLGSRYGHALRFIDVNRLLPLGAGGEEGKEVVEDAEGWWGTLLDIGRLRLSGMGVRVESVPRCWVRHHAARDGLGRAHLQAILDSLRPCWMGVGQLALDPWGRVKLCPAGPPLGPSILDVDPESYWRKDLLLKRRRELRFLHSHCVDYDSRTLCDEFYSCGGGCRTGAGTALGAPDPLSLGPAT